MIIRWNLDLSALVFCLLALAYRVTQHQPSNLYHLLNLGQRHSIIRRT